MRMQWMTVAFRGLLVAALGVVCSAQAPLAIPSISDAAKVTAVTGQVSVLRD